MKKEESKSIIGELFSMLWEVWSEIFSAIWDLLPKAFSLIGWVLVGIFILPCVLVSNYWYPVWVEWGEEI